MDNREDKKRKMIIIIGCVTIILISVIVSVKTILNANKEEPIINKESDAVHQDVLNDAKVGNLTITNAMLTVDNGMSNFVATVINNTNKTTHFNHLYAVFVIDGNTQKISCIEDVTLEKGQKEYIYITFDTDISEVTKIEYEID